MPLVPAICTQCGSPIEVDNAKEAGICPRCGTAFITEKVINNYITQHVSNTSVNQTIVKNVYGREKTEAEEYAARGLSFLGMGEYIEAAGCFDSAVKCEPGNIENHILLYRALTFDFRLYYGGLTDPERQQEITFYSFRDKVTLNEVFGRIDKLARQADISALQKQYGYTFRKDKNFWLESYRAAARLYAAQSRGEQPEEIALLKKANAPFTDFHVCAAYAVENLYADPHFSAQERAAFFEEYLETFRDEESGVLTVLTYKLFPCKNKVYDLTGYGGAVVPARLAWVKDDTLPNLRVSAENIRSAKEQRILPSSPIRAKKCIIAAEPTVRADGTYVECETLQFEEGIEAIRNASKKPAFVFWNLSFPSTLKSIGGYLFNHDRISKSMPPEKPVLFPDGLERLGEQAFGKSKYPLTAAVLPKSLTDVGKLPFGARGPGYLVCLCDTAAWSSDWCTYQEKSVVSGKNTLYSYAYLDVPNNTYRSKYSLTNGETEKLRAQLSDYKKYAQFDESKTKFAGPDGKEQKQGCYIATAVYGSYDCPPVWTLRRYRDLSLRRSAPGRLFVKLYYAISPALVKLFGKQKWFRALWRRALDKKVQKLNARGFADTPYDDR